MRRLLMPIAVLAAAIAVERTAWKEGAERTVWGEWAAALSSPHFPRVILALVFLLAWRFGRGRLAWAAVLLAFYAEVVEWKLTGVEPALAVSLPLSLGILGFLSDWKVVSRAGLWRFAALAAPVAALVVLARRGASAEGTWLPRSFGLGDWFGRLGGPELTDAGRAAFLVAGVALVAIVLRRRRPVEAGLAGALAASFLAFAGGGERAAYHLAVGGVILALALVENAFSLAFEDGLTGLPARRALEESLRHLGSTYAIAMVDLDHFKKFNDRHGHEVGDQVLQMVASKLGRVGGGGRSFRYGGEEFSVVFSGKTVSEAEPVLEELRRTVASSAFAVRSPTRPKKKPRTGRKPAGATGTIKKLRVTISIGLAERSDKNRTAQEVLKAADRALYRSKKAGRNRVTVGR